MILRLLAIAVIAGIPAFGQQLQTGVVHEKIVCRQDPSQSYALYLPKAYTPDRRWPIIYAFDPFARGNAPLELMKAAAEKAGFIVAGSSNSRNGPVKDSIAAAQAMWADTHQRLAIDQKQRYATGLSGGARVAATLAQLCGNCIAGVVGQSAGFHDSTPPTKNTQFVFFGTAGNLDFNYTELVELDKKLNDVQVPHRIRVFAGTHQYATPEIWDEAFAWLELQAMRRGLRPRDQSFIAQQQKAGLERAAQFEAHGDLLQALREYRGLVADFEGLADTSAAAVKLAEFQSRKDVKDALKADRSAIERQRHDFQDAFTSLALVRTEPENAATALAKTGAQLSILRAEVRKNKDENAPQVIPVRRTLLQILSQAIEMGQQAIRDREYALAITYFDLVIQYARAAPLAHFEKARALALAGRSKEVLPALRKAVEAGFDEPAALESAAEFAALRDKPEFREIVESARQKRE